MKKDYYFDNTLKSAINDNARDVKASSDIFNEAWSKKCEYKSRKKYFNIQCIRKVAFVAACCVAFCIGGAFTFSPHVRAAAQEVFKTIFVLDKSGNVVEKSEDEKIPVATNWGRITDANKNEMEKKFGFKINLPKKICSFSYEKTNGIDIDPLVIIIAHDVKFKDSDNVINKLMKAENENKALEEIDNDYKTTKLVSSTYVDNKGNDLHVGVLKKDKNPQADSDREVTIENVKCSLEKVSRPKYHTKMISDRIEQTDLTKKPIRVDESYSISWIYEGVAYCVDAKKDSDVDTTIEFVKEYIKILKQE